VWKWLKPKVDPTYNFWLYSSEEEQALWIACGQPKTTTGIPDMAACLNEVIISRYKREMPDLPEEYLRYKNKNGLLTRYAGIYFDSNLSDSIKRDLRSELADWASKQRGFSKKCKTPKDINRFLIDKEGLLKYV
jgi:hypothetical protein